MIQSPLNYTGGKYKLLPQILPLFPKDINCFVDLFCGGCNVGINVCAKKYVYNDSCEPLINLYSVMQTLDSASFIEKIETVQEEIPYETITKDVSDGSDNKKDRVIQEGKNGLKEVTYKVKYQNDTEIERTEIYSTIITEPVNKVIEVRKQYVTSRSSGARVSYSNGVWSYSNAEFDLLCAITAQECSSSYEGALAVITTACNRAESTKWAKNGSDPLSQYKAKGQFCYSIDGHWRRRLNGNYASYVAEAVSDALNGKRNHNYLSFRSAGHASGEYIGGNVYF